MINDIKMQISKKFIILFYIILSVCSPNYVFSTDKISALKMYNLPNIIDNDALKNFAKTHNISLIYDVFDSDNTLDSKLMAGSTGYDLVVPTFAPLLLKHMQVGMYEKLEHKKIDNYRNIDPALISLMSRHPDALDYGIPLVWGTVGIGVNINKVNEIMPDAPIDSLSLIFDPEIMKKISKCGVAMLDSPSDVIPAALVYNNLDPTRYNIDDLKKAEKSLMDIRPYIKYFHSSKFIDDLASGELCVVFAYSGDILQAAKTAYHHQNNIDIKYFPPKEGALVWIDVLSILKNSPNTEDAYDIINYLLDSKISAENTNKYGFANANIASKIYLNDNISNDHNIYLTEDKMKKAYIAAAIDNKTEKAANRTWLRVVTNK